MRKPLLLVVLCTVVLCGCNSGEARVPDDWRQHTGACAVFGGETDQRYTLWYPPEWTEEPEGMFPEIDSFEAIAREGDAYVSVMCADTDPVGYWGDAGDTIEGALQESIASKEKYAIGGKMEILDAKILEESPADMLIISYTDTFPIWEHTVEIDTYGSPVLSLRYSAYHDVSERERALLLDVMRTVRFSE